MEKLKDIKLQKGDIVYFASGHSETVENWVYVFENYENLNNSTSRGPYYGKIIKIERPVTIYEEPKPILEKEEKEYLENVIRPFKDNVLGISKHIIYGNGKEYIEMKIKNDGVTSFPCFNAGSMYKGMEKKKEYTIKELGLFEGE